MPVTNDDLHAAIVGVEKDVSWIRELQLEAKQSRKVLADKIDAMAESTRIARQACESRFCAVETGQTVTKLKLAGIIAVIMTAFQAIIAAATWAFHQVAEGIVKPPGGGP